MKNILLLLLIHISALSFGQSIMNADSMEVIRLTEIFFEALETKNFDDLSKITAPTIACYPCFENYNTEKFYHLTSKEFYDRYQTSEHLKILLSRASNSESITFQFIDTDNSAIVIWYVIYEKDELESGHEGGQLGLSFEWYQDQYKIAGVETVP